LISLVRNMPSSVPMAFTSSFGSDSDCGLSRTLCRATACMLASSLISTDCLFISRNLVDTISRIPFSPNRSTMLFFRRCSTEATTRAISLASRLVRPASCSKSSWTYKARSFAGIFRRGDSDVMALLLCLSCCGSESRSTAKRTAALLT
jgi:hypothetical protein